MARAKTSDRTKRIPFGVANRKLTVDRGTAARLRAKGMVPRFVNDERGRLEAALAGGYEFVSVNSREPIATGDTASEQDTRVRELVGTQSGGAALYAYLMAIPRKYYEEDQAAKEAVNYQVDEQIRSGNPAGLEGHGVSPDRGGSSVKNVSYTP